MKTEIRFTPNEDASGVRPDVVSNKVSVSRDTEPEKNEAAEEFEDEEPTRIK